MSSELLLYMTITFGAACVQGSVGFGFALLCVPLVSLFAPEWAPFPQLILSLPLGLSVFAFEHKHTKYGGVLWTSVGRIPGNLAGAALLAFASAAVLELTLGIAVLVAAILVALGRSVPRTRLSETIAGAVSSAAAVIAAVGGPPIALLYADERGPVIRGTLSAIAVIGIAMAIAIRLGVAPLRDADIHAVLWGLPAVGAGVVLSRVVSKRLDEGSLRPLIAGLSALAALALIVRGLLEIWR